MSMKNNRFYREPRPASLLPPAACGELAEQAIGDYVKACGAFGDAAAIPKVLEMLISKAALGAVTVSDPLVTQQILFRTMLTIEALALQQPRRAS
ncbi:hypothetical protein [Burkholderia sp. JKS000303]|uniref:hypothetical protein n=1 Tax=Burkholderia sp. JKS000303 TaxID=1938747 RepID=UPI000C007662|nr:hypothetical protein [Burkholderia sp. JKS000303]PFH29096.1 hypothetical protein BX604_2868 [Burkholderia sp. JKS000303]